MFAHPGEEKAERGKKQLLPAGSGSPQGQAVPTACPGPAAGGEQAPDPAWPRPSCLLPPTTWKHSAVFFQANAKHFTPGNQRWQVDKSFPFAVEERLLEILLLKESALSEMRFRFRDSAQSFICQLPPAFLTFDGSLLLDLLLLGYPFLFSCD